MQIEIRSDRDRRRAVLRWRRSGMAAHDFAPQLGVSTATLYAWSRRFRPEAGADGTGRDGVGDSRAVTDAARLVELVPVGDPGRSKDPADVGAVEIALTLRCGRTLRFPPSVDDGVLRRLVAAVESM